MSTLFDKTSIKTLSMQNRIIRSATWEGMCDDQGRPTRKLIECYQKLSRGGVGMIVTGYAYIRPDGKQLPGQLGIYTDHFSSEMRALTNAVHNEGGKICIQLLHAGGQTDSIAAGRKPLAPSPVKTAQYTETPEELSEKEISEIIDAFGSAAARAKAFRFDAVQLHGAHGYLINQFLSGHTNLRTDKYGGNIQNRCRFMMEVYRKVRERVGDNYPVMIKLTGSDFLPGIGFTLKEALYASEFLSDEGIDAIEVSGGTAASGKNGPARTKIEKPEQEAYNFPLARGIKKKVKCPVMVVGGFRSHQVTKKTVELYGMDYVSFSRPLIREPYLPYRWSRGDTARAKCISCNGCFRPGLKEGGVYCVLDTPKGNG